MNNDRNKRLEKQLEEIKGNADKGVALAIFGGVIITLILSLQFHSLLPVLLAAVVALVLQFNTAGKKGAKKKSGACEIVIRYNEKGTPPEHRTPDGNPLVITRRMQDALISVPLGTAIDFTKAGIPAKKVVLHNYDNTAFDYAWLPDGFRLTVKTNIPEGRARTTDISVDDEPFWLEFAFSHACP